MKINNVAEIINERNPASSVEMGLHTSQGLMGLSALKQYMNIKGLKMPSMNYTHYVRFVKHPQVVLEWLLNCNFLPLFYTGNTTSAEEACNAQYFLDNLQDDIEGVHDRYPITNHTLDSYKALIPAAKITPHMVLDFRGIELAGARVGWDTVNAYIVEVCMYIKETQDLLETYGKKWDIEKNHNPMITILTDDHGGDSVVLDTDDMQRVHKHENYDECPDSSGYGTCVQTYVRVYTKQQN